MSTFGLGIVKRNTWYLLLAIHLFPLVGVLIALYPPTVVVLAGLLGGVLFFILPIEAVMLIAIGLAPLSNLFIVKADIFDFRLVQILWLFVFIRKIVQSLEKRSISLPKTDIWKPLAFLILAALLSTLISIQPQISLKELIQLFYLFVMFYTIATSFNRTELLIKAVNVLAVATLVVTIIGLVTAYLGVSPLPVINIDLLNNMNINLDFSNVIFSHTTEGFQAMRLHSVNLSSVATAALLTQMILILFFLLWNSGALGFELNKKFYGIVLILSVYAWFLTNSRASIVTLFVLLFIGILISGRRRFTLIFLVFLFLGILILTPTFSRLKDSFILEASTNPGHFALWYEAIRIFLRNPLLGIGIGMFPFTVTDFLWFFNMQTFTSGLNDVHNMFIKSAAEMGILGVGALIWFFYIFFRDLIKSYMYSRGQTWSVIILAFLLAALAGFLMNLTTNIFTKEFTWTIWGLAYAAVLMSTEMENLPAESQQLRSMT